MPDKVSVRQSIMILDDTEKVNVTIPEWKGVVIEVRSMTAEQRAQLVDTLSEMGKPSWAHVYPDVLLLTCYDPETGEAVFGPGDRDTLKKKNSKAVERLARKALELAGLLGNLDDTAKN